MCFSILFHLKSYLRLEYFRQKHNHVICLLSSSAIYGNRRSTVVSYGHKVVKQPGNGKNVIIPGLRGWSYGMKAVLDKQRPWTNPKYSLLVKRLRKSGIPPFPLSRENVIYNPVWRSYTSTLDSSMCVFCKYPGLCACF